MMELENFVMSQDFNWHDVSGNGKYAFGEDGYLVMDGSTCKIQCHRFLKKKIVDGTGILEVKMRVVFGKPYHIYFYDGADQLAMDCLIDSDGWIKFRRRDEYVNSGKYITYGLGLPCVDTEFSRPWWYAVESDEVIYRFGNFDFAKRNLDLTVTVPNLEEKVTMENCLLTRASDISKLELQTGVAEPGTRIRLRDYRQYKNGNIIDHEEFPYHWQPVPAPPDGYPHDNICETRLRPVGNRWLETSTFYGWVQVRMPLLPEGELDYEIMTPDVEKESCLQLEEYRGSQLFTCPIGVLIMNGKFGCTIPSGKRHSRVVNRDFEGIDLFYFDEPIPRPRQVYSIKIAWYKSCHFRVWIDGTPMKINDSYDIPMTKRAEDFRGIDTVNLHPGHAGIRPTLAQKKKGESFPEDAKPHLTYWGKFRVKAQQTLNKRDSGSFSDR